MKLTLPQQDVYFEQLLYSNDPIYNIGAKILIEGSIDFSVFNLAYKHLINQHDAYRTHFFTKDEEVVSAVKDVFEGELLLVDFSNKENANEVADNFMQEEFMKPFSILSDDCLHKFILVKVSQTKHYLFSVYHHIITDGWGTSLMFQRLVQNYNEVLVYGKVVSEYPYSYKNFINDDEDYQESEAYEADKKYWVEKFENLPDNLFEKKDANSQLNKSSRKRLIIKREIYNQLNDLAKEYKSTTFHLLLALLYIYFGRKHQNNDFAIGLPVLNRGKSIFKKTVGLFMGVAPLRLQINFEDTIAELIVAIKNQLRKDYRHQRFPLGKLIKELQIFQEKEKVFNMTLSYEKQDYASNFQNTKTRVIPLTHQSERVALAIYIREFDVNEDVSVDFDYNLNFFDEVSISQVTQHFECLLNNVLDTPAKKLKDLDYLTKEEENELLYKFNTTEVSYNKEGTLLDVFKERVQQAPNKVALLDGEETYSYKELDTLSNQIATYILKYPEAQNTNNIGVLLDRSAVSVAVMLGILKAGKSFIPLDPIFPEDRLQYIIAHSEMKLLISNQKSISFSEVKSISLSELISESKKINDCFFNTVTGFETAYIIYTSGSTGNPKGVQIGHQSLLNFLLSIEKTPGIQKEDLLFAVTTYSFDISILELFVPLISGASVFVANNEILKDPTKLIQVLEDVKPSIIQATPSFYQLLFNAGWKGSKYIKVLCGGDLLSEDLASNLLTNCGELWNMYGPTETTIWSSVKQITNKEEASNIGKPIQNTQFYIVDKFFKPLPIGSSGALYIAGDGLAKGYFKAEHLTNEKFIKNVFNEETLFYATNDVAKWNAKGEVEFLGRDDNQVKIRGYRIELGEIETKLNALNEVKQAVVIAKKKNNQDAFLVAYVIKENENFNAQTCIESLGIDLPKYMVPNTFIEVDSFPLTPNKKVNRKVLTERSIAETVITKEFKRPENELQKKLSILWKETLQYEGEISINDNFFSLGGHSLNAVKLIHQINNTLQYFINLKTLFDYPTVASLANYLSTVNTKEIKYIPIAIKKDYYTITPSQQDIWLASQHENRSIAYNMTSAFCTEGGIDINKINNAVQQVVLEHEILRTNFVEREGDVFQIIKDKAITNIKVSLVQTEESNVSDEIDKYINKAFDLENDSLIKMQIIKTNTAKTILVFCAHHIILDGWSLERFTTLFLEYYNKEVESIPHKNERIQFKDYAEWFNEKKEIEESITFWETSLKAYDFKESFTTTNFGSEEVHKGQHFRFEFSKEETIRLNLFLKEQKTTMHSFLIAALNVLIYKFSGHEDIVLGTVNSGRNEPQLNDMLGMFVKTLPLRTELLQKESFYEVAKKIQENILKIDEYQNIPKAYRNKQLFDVLVAFQNPDFSYQESIQLNNIELTPYLIDTSYSRVPLLFNFFEVKEQLRGVISFDTGKYDKEIVEVIVLKFKKLIQEIISDPFSVISDLEILLDFEKQEMIEIDFNF